MRWLFTVAIHPLALFRRLWPLRWAEKSVMVVCMQTLDNSMRLIPKRSFFFLRKRLTSVIEGAHRPPGYIRIANQAIRKMAQRIRGVAQSFIPEAVFNRSATAHILGGCPMGTDRNSGVIDKYGNIFGYKNLKVVDGSMIPINLGVNPSLTITALAEYAMEDVEPAECG